MTLVSPRVPIRRIPVSRTLEPQLVPNSARSDAPRHTVQQPWISDVTTATVFGIHRTLPAGRYNSRCHRHSSRGLHENDEEAAIRGDQQAIEMMVYFKKTDQESAVEAEMGGEVDALRKQLEKLESMW